MLHEISLFSLLLHSTHMFNWTSRGVSKYILQFRLLQLSWLHLIKKKAIYNSIFKNFIQTTTEFGWMYSFLFYSISTLFSSLSIYIYFSYSPLKKPIFILIFFSFFVQAKQSLLRGVEKIGARWRCKQICSWQAHVQPPPYALFNKPSPTRPCCSSEKGKS